MGITANPPNSDQLEIALIGPGHGECVVVHLGDSQWIVVDSCIDKTTGKPAAIQYLDSIGQRPSEVVRLILVTHWHDDHIRGLAQIVEECPNAKFCMSSAMGAEEFLAVVSAYDVLRFSNCTSGVREIHEVIKLRSNNSATVTHAAPNRLAYKTTASHGLSCEVWTLSPADAQISKFHEEIGGLIPEVGRTMQRCVPQRPNHLATVAWINVGATAILLGSDLEETKDNRTGWSVIVESNERPLGKAEIFKVPHHGSENAHNEDVWTEMLGDKPYSILTPYRRSNLPRPSDIERVLRMSDRSFSTAKVATKRTQKRDAAVSKTLREMGVTIVESEPSLGVIRLRNGGSRDFGSWSVELLDGACHLAEV